MTSLSNYLNDGANHQAQAVLCFLRNLEIKESYNETQKRYEAEPKVARWENCREQGYVLCMRNNNYAKQINIAWFEHRNSDSICAVKWEQTTTNSPTIESAVFGDVYKKKYDVSHEEGYGRVEAMASWISNELKQWWVANKI